MLLFGSLGFKERTVTSVSCLWFCLQGCKGFRRHRVTCRCRSLQSDLWRLHLPLLLWVNTLSHNPYWHAFPIMREWNFSETMSQAKHGLPFVALSGILLQVRFFRSWLPLPLCLLVFNNLIYLFYWGQYLCFKIPIYSSVLFFSKFIELYKKHHIPVLG